MLYDRPLAECARQNLRLEWTIVPIRREALAKKKGRPGMRRPRFLSLELVDRQRYLGRQSDRVRIGAGSRDGDGIRAGGRATASPSSTLVAASACRHHEQGSHD